MANTTRQVQSGKTSLIQEITSKNALAMATQLLAEIEEKRHPFREVPGGKRRYPGESAGRYLAGRLNEISQLRPKRRPLLESLRLFHSFAKAAKKGPVDVRKHAKRLLRTTGYLFESALNESSVKDREMSIHEDGIIVHPGTAESKAALAVLVLEKTRRLERIKRCLRCKSWFYARFKHQKFCSDPKKKCQWDHYHSPEWRKQNRERNRRHQRRYRETLF